MANKDYVRRNLGNSNKQNNKKSPARNKAPARKAPSSSVLSGKPWRSGLLALVLVAAFGYGLYVLNSDPEPVESSPEMDLITAVQQQPMMQQEVLPEPPIERWDYVDELPKREVEVVAKELAVSKIPYVMQCGAYKQAGPAESRKASIAFLGMKSKVVRRPNSSWYRVILGPYTTNREAMRDLHKLQRSKIEPCMIFRESEY